MTNIKGIQIGERIYGADELVDSHVVAQMTGLSRRTIQDMTSKRDLPMYKIGNRIVRYKVRELIDWIEDHAVSSGNYGTCRFATEEQVAE